MSQQHCNLFLIGFMGAGKSMLAKYLHRHYGMEVLEMDEAIEQREGMSISEIFEKYGEEYFRKCETELLMELQNRENLVISCGGGVPMRACNVEAMRKSGRVVFLTARPETVLERVKAAHNRPLLEGHKDVAYIEDLMEKRREKYEAAADIQVATDSRSVRAICEEVLGFSSPNKKGTGSLRPDML